MENIKTPRISRPEISELRRRWKTVLALAVVASSSFMVGAYANRITVGIIQSVAGNRVLVPPPELQIVATTWSIDPQKSLVTDVDLLVTTNSPVWQLKLYQIFIQVSCLDETVTPPVEIICSNGQARIVLPTHGIGLRPIKIVLDKPINPETIEIHDLSFIVTDLGRVPPMPPTIFVGPTDVSIQVEQGSSVRVPIHVVGVAGVLAGTQVTVTSSNLPNGITETDPAPLTLMASPGSPGVVMIDSFFDIFADLSAMIGSSDIQLMVTGPSLSDIAILQLDVIQHPVPHPGELPNLHFPNCALPPTVNFLVDCLGSGAGGIAGNLVVENNGPVASAPTTVDASGDATCADPSAICAVPALAPGGTFTVTVVCNTFNPDCNFGVKIDPANIVAESNELDNDMLGLILG